MTTPARPSGREAAGLYAAVALGSLAGGALRGLASLAGQNWWGTGFPWSTLFVNVLGSLIIGFYAAIAGPGGRLPAGPKQQQFVMAGFCGGFTTFSAFSLETLQLIQAGRTAVAIFYVGVSVPAWLAAAWLGQWLGRYRSRLSVGPSLR